MKTKELDHSTAYPTARGVLLALTTLAAIFAVLGIMVGLATQAPLLIEYGVVGLIGIFFQYMLFDVLFDISDQTRQTRDAIEQLYKEMELRPGAAHQPDLPKANLGPTRYNPKTHEYEAI